MLRLTSFALLLYFLIIGGAKAQNISVSYSGYPIDGGTKKDSAMTGFLSGYRDSVSKSMGAVIGFSISGLTKHQPESGLGNFMADAVKTIGEQVFHQSIDAAVINYGGIRSYLPKGDVTLGNIFELMPFDNQLVLQKVKGDSLLSFLNHIADKNGWPLSGITMGIKDKMAVNILVNGNPLSNDSTYTIANSDYIANGGDNTNMLKVFPQITKGYLIRDALIAYVKQLTEQGKPIDAKTEKRIVYAN
jgi:2',3'-cyclic-nucleotide 2'-phosphodiesterase (5'-nucleotidase family)